jgi:predicted DNA-binding protein (MmcQ/YjbR family)
MNESEDRRLTRLTKIALALPETKRELRGRHAQFHVRDKTFAWYLDNHHGDGIVAVSAKMAPGENKEVAELDPKRFYLPAYMAHHGWIALRLDVGKVDWKEVEELVKESYRLMAPKKLAAQAAQRWPARPARRRR